MVLIFGKYSDLFLEHLNFINSKYYLFANLKDLISFLKLIIKAYKYDYILFSPGGESFDSYKDYSDRGYSFNKLIKKIL